MVKIIVEQYYSILNNKRVLTKKIKRLKNKWFIMS